MPQDTVTLDLGGPIRFLALEWREHWEFDHPSVLLEPFVRYRPDGASCESLIEDAAIDVAVDGPAVPSCMHPSEAKEFAWRGWDVAELKSIAEACLARPGRVRFGTGYVAARERWVAFRPGKEPGDIEFGYVEVPPA